MRTAGSRGLITVKDIQKREKYPYATKDDQGRLRVGAAVGVGPTPSSAPQPSSPPEVDVLVVDTAHGHSHGVIDDRAAIKGELDVALIAGNVATAEAVRPSPTPAPTP